MKPILGDQLPLREDLRPYGYAPGNYMGMCYTGNHQMTNVDKRATCCLECAEKIHEGKEMSIAPLTTEQSPYKSGLLTAVKDSAVAMTIERIGGDGQIHTLRFEGAKLIREHFSPEILIGAGTELVFSGGAFVRAQ